MSLPCVLAAPVALPCPFLFLILILLDVLIDVVSHRGSYLYRPALPSFARRSARLFQLSPLCPLTCLVHNTLVNRPRNLACRERQALRASSAIALCFFAFHTPVAIMAAYVESYLIHTGCPPAMSCLCAHCSPRVKAVSSATLLWWFLHGLSVPR